MALPQYDTPIGVGGKIDTKTGVVLTGANAGQMAGQNDNAVGSTNGYSPANTPIPLSTLNAPVQAPYTPTQPAPTTGSAGLQGAISAGTDQFTQNLADQANAAKDPAQKGLSDLIQNMLNSEGATALTAKEYANTGVDSTQAELKTINNRILAEQRAADNEIRLAKENPLGLSTEGVNRQIQDITDKSVQRQADLAVIQMAKQGQYDSAKQIADRAVAAKVERQKTINDALQLNYQELKDTFTKAEQRQFETAQKDRERTLEMTAYKEKAKYDQIIKQSDPLYAAQLSKARADATKAAIDAGIGGNVAPTQSPLDQLKFLRETATSAKTLANQSGQGKITKTFGDLVGGSKYRQLEANTNTLRTNVLTLATDPSVKKYFGPQMSEADVRLMTAAGTTLNPENQSPQQLKDELVRLDNLFERMQTALNNGVRVEQSGGKLQTAPDGTVIEIID